MDNVFFSTFYLYKDHKQLVLSAPKKAFIQYRDFRVNLLTGERSIIDVQCFLEELTLFKVDSFVEAPVVLHLFYEFGFLCTEQVELLDQNKPLAIFIEYEDEEVQDIYDVLGDEPFHFTPLSLLNLKEYSKKFYKAYAHLLSGNCYQLNLTSPFYFRSSINISPNAYIGRLWSDPFKVGAYAHGTYIDSLGKLFFSNSPECLFQISKRAGKYYAKTMPIKGTQVVENETEVKRNAAWDILSRSEKDQAELFMITDLMRNDLTKINLKPAKVLHKKYPLNVPGLIHQFSVVEAEVSPDNTLKDLVKALFPGGSITGAPKKNVMKLTKGIEGYERGFYCGSTILLYKNLKTASINIRSAEVDYLQNEVKYGSGGAVTLKSELQQEYDESLAKLKSFLLLLG